MRMWVVVLAMVTGLAVGSLVTNQVSAQAPLQDYTFVVDTAGETWLILRTGPNSLVRVGVPIFPAAEADIAAVPASGQWLIPGDGPRIAVERPGWAVVRPTTQQSIAAPLAGIQAAIVAAATPTTVTPPAPVAAAAPLVEAAAPPAPAIAALPPLEVAPPPVLAAIAAPAAPVVAAAPPVVEAVPVVAAPPVVATIATPTATTSSSAPLFPSATFTPLALQGAAQGAPVVLNALSYEKDSSIVQKGRGERDTAKFALAGGNYQIRWEARVKSKADDVCSFVARLKDEAVGGTFNTFANKRNITTSREERVRLDGVPPSQTYFFEVDGSCDWEIEIERS